MESEVGFYLSSIPFSPSHSSEFRLEDMLRIKDANRVRLAALSIENSFDSLVENYFEFEKDCVDVAHRMLVSFYGGDEVVHGYQLLLNRRLMNVMTAAKAYQDHLNNCLKEIFREEGKYSSFYNSMWRNLHRLSPQFRAMNCLRNYVQHYEFPVHGYDHSAAWDIKNGKKDTMKVNLRLKVIVDKLLEDERFRKDADPDVISCLRRQSLPSVISKYIENIWSFHSSFRKEIKKLLDTSDVAVNEVFRDFENTFSLDGVSGLAVYEINDNGCVSSQENIFRRVEKIRIKLCRKNSSLGSVSRAYIVTKLFDDEESALT